MSLIATLVLRRIIIIAVKTRMTVATSDSRGAYAEWLTSFRIGRNNGTQASRIRLSRKLRYQAHAIPSELELGVSPVTADMNASCAGEKGPECDGES